MSTRPSRSSGGEKRRRGKGGVGAEEEKEEILTTANFQDSDEEEEHIWMTKRCCRRWMAWPASDAAEGLFWRSAHSDGKTVLGMAAWGHRVLLHARYQHPHQQRRPAASNPSALEDLEGNCGLEEEEETPLSSPQLSLAAMRREGYLHWRAGDVKGRRAAKAKEKQYEKNKTFPPCRRRPRRRQTLGALWCRRSRGHERVVRRLLEGGGAEAEARVVKETEAAAAAEGEDGDMSTTNQGDVELPPPAASLSLVDPSEKTRRRSRQQAPRG